MDNDRLLGESRVKRKKRRGLPKVGLPDIPNPSRGRTRQPNITRGIPDLPKSTRKQDKPKAGSIFASSKTGISNRIPDIPRKPVSTQTSTMRSSDGSRSIADATAKAKAAGLKKMGDPNMKKAKGGSTLQSAMVVGKQLNSMAQQMRKKRTKPII